MIDVEVATVHTASNMVVRLPSPSCRHVLPVLETLTPGSWQLLTSLHLPQIRVFGSCLHASFIGDVSVNDYILCGFESAAQMYSVFFLEESKLEQIRRNMLVS